MDIIYKDLSGNSITGQCNFAPYPLKEYVYPEIPPPIVNPIINLPKTDIYPQFTVPPVQQPIFENHFAPEFKPEFKPRIEVRISEDTILDSHLKVISFSLAVLAASSWVAVILYMLQLCGVFHEN